MAQMIALTMIGRPAAALSRSPRRKPSQTAATISASGEPVRLVELGGEAHLGVDDAVVGEIDGRLVGDPFERGRPIA